MIVTVCATTLAGYLKEAPEPAYLQQYHLPERPTQVADWAPSSYSTSSGLASGSSSVSWGTICGGHPAGGGAPAPIATPGI
jgi:hypothetical protein